MEVGVPIPNGLSMMSQQHMLQNSNIDVASYAYHTPINPSPSATSLSQSDKDAASPEGSTSQPGSVGTENARSQAQPSRTPTAIPAACLACRSKHLKCDGNKPCSRCQTSELECTYIASRRGFKGPRRSGNPHKRQATSPPSETECGLISSGPAVVPSFAIDPALNMAPVPQHDMQLFTFQGQTAATPSRTLAQTTTDVPLPERCLQAYYHYFFASHPFVLPRDFLIPLTKQINLEPLLAALRWAGSLFLDYVNPQIKESLLAAAFHLIDHHPVRDGFLLQAMMVLIVGLDGSSDQEQARALLQRAESLAISLQISSRGFATAHGRRLPVLEESWRRTWWDLFIIDGMIAGVHQITTFALYDVPADAGLPCEELEYLSGVIPPPKSLEDLENLEFSFADTEYSSFAYRILCGRNLGRFMRLSPIQGPNDENLTRVETSLTNWRLHLPISKKDAIRSDGKPDEMMFQALMMFNATSLLLHQQHSQLDTSPTRSVTSCAPYRPIKAGKELFNIHTHHTLVAANEISKLITHPAALLTHTHFFTCVVTLSSIVHLSRWAQHFYITSTSPEMPMASPLPYQQALGNGVDDDLRQLIRLNIGALGQLSAVWGAAQKARDSVQGVARDIYQAKKQQQMSSAYWTGFSEEEVVSTIAADDTIIGDIQSF